MTKIAAHGTAVFLTLLAFFLLPCADIALADAGEEEPMTEEEMSFEDFDEGLDSLEMDEEIPASEVDADTIEDVPEDTVELEDDSWADEDVVGEETDDADMMMDALDDASEPAEIEEPAESADEELQVESTVDEIESIETEAVVFDHSGEVIALALQLKVAETDLTAARLDLERLRAEAAVKTDDSVVDELRAEVERSQTALEALKRAATRGDDTVEQFERIAALENELKQETKQVKTLRAEVERALADLGEARSDLTLAEKALEEAEAEADKSGDLAKAEKELDRLRDLVRRIWQANRREKLNMHYNMAAAYRAGGMMAKAEHHYMEALKIDPEDGGVHYNLAILYDDEMKNRKKAREHYEKFLELSPDDKDAAKVVEWLSTMD